MWGIEPRSLGESDILTIGLHRMLLLSCFTALYHGATQTTANEAGLVSRAALNAKNCCKKVRNSEGRLWSYDLWVMGPTRFHCATSLVWTIFWLCYRALFHWATGPKYIYIGPGRFRSYDLSLMKENKNCCKKIWNSESRFWSYDLWVMGPTRFLCATSLKYRTPRAP